MQHHIECPRGKIIVRIVKEQDAPIAPGAIVPVKLYDHVEAPAYRMAEVVYSGHSDIAAGDSVFVVRGAGIPVVLPGDELLMIPATDAIAGVTP